MYIGFVNAWNSSQNQNVNGKYANKKLHFISSCYKDKNKMKYAKGSGNNAGMLNDHC